MLPDTKLWLVVLLTRSRVGRRLRNRHRVQRLYNTRFLQIDLLDTTTLVAVRQFDLPTVGGEQLPHRERQVSAYKRVERR